MCSHTIYDRKVPNPENFTPIQRFRFDQKLWERFGRVVGTRGRSAILGAFVRWYLREPGAKLPKRPEVGE